MTRQRKPEETYCNFATPFTSNLAEYGIMTRTAVNLYLISLTFDHNTFLTAIILLGKSRPTLNYKRACDIVSSTSLLLEKAVIIGLVRLPCLNEALSIDIGSSRTSSFSRNWTIRLAQFSLQHFCNP